MMLSSAVRRNFLQQFPKISRSAEMLQWNLRPGNALCGPPGWTEAAADKEQLPQALAMKTNFLQFKSSQRIHRNFRG